MERWDKRRYWVRLMSMIIDRKIRVGVCIKFDIMLVIGGIGKSVGVIWSV